MAGIHTTAVIDTKAKIGQNVTIGPFCVIGPNVELDNGVVLHSHTVVEGRTKIGAGSQIYPFASIGCQPQDLKFHGEQSELIVGQDNVIREHVTMNPGTEGGGMKTQIGNGCLFMVGAHVAHDCQIGNSVIMANNATLGGHVVVEDGAIIGGLSAVHQFVRIGRYAMVGGMSGVENDVIPYGMVMGERASLSGLNVVGLKRRGVEREKIQTVLNAFSALFKDVNTLADRVAQVEANYGGVDIVDDILTFIHAESSRALCQPKPGNGKPAA